MDNQNQIIINPKPELKEESKEQLTSTTIICNNQALKAYKALLGGRYGILTSHNAFLYQYFFANFNNEPLALDLLTLINQDLNILKTLGNLIILNGGNPKFISNLGNFWNAKYLSYPTTKPLAINYLIKLITEQINLMNKLKTNQNNNVITELNKIIDIKQTQIGILNKYL